MITGMIRGEFRKLLRGTLTTFEERQKKCTEGYGRNHIALAEKIGEKNKQEEKANPQNPDFGICCHNRKFYYFLIFSFSERWHSVMLPKNWTEI